MLLTVVIDDFLGGVLDSLHVSIDLSGVSLMPLLLGFVSMFGVGGLIGTQLLQLDSGRASLLGGVAGVLGAAFVFTMFSLLRRSEGAPPFSLRDLVGQTARVSVAIPARRYGSVYLSFAGGSHNLTATSDVDVPSGATVTVTGVAGSHLIVAPSGGGTA